MQKIPEKLVALRRLMQQSRIDYYLVPSADQHRNEYLPHCWRRRTWITGFDGSAGDALIGLNKAYLWTDPRYFLQAERQLDPAHYELMRMAQGQTPAIDEWLNEQQKPLRCGVDPKTISIQMAERLKTALTEYGGELVSIENNLVDQLWEDRPALPKAPVYCQPEKYAGETASQKIERVRKALTAHHAQSLVVTMLDSIAWLYNIRGNDVDYNPVTISYGLVTQTEAFLFIDHDKLSPEIIHYLKEHHITVKPYADFTAALNKLSESVLVDPSITSWWVLQQLQNARCIFKPSPIVLMKAIKNPAEQNGMREAHLHDGVAVIKFLHWIENHWKEGITELSAEKQLEKFRRENPVCLDLSFNTIAGFADHAAIIHYSASEETNRTIDDSGVLLVDSGGQYPMGTTDITRTIHLGQPTADQKRHYTLVLKGHLALRDTIFPHGVCGEHINAIAHRALWQEALDFHHGTGHGVGCHLCVHEGPQMIGYLATGIALQPGMVVSNEPGVYIPGQYGFRIENLVLIVEKYPASASLTQHGPFYGFEELTFAPHARNLIDTALLSDQEIAQLNEYHQQVYKRLSPRIDDPELLTWLKIATAPLD